MISLSISYIVVVPICMSSIIFILSQCWHIYQESCHQGQHINHNANNSPLWTWWKPLWSLDTFCKHTCKCQDFTPNTSIQTPSLLSPFDVKGKALNQDKWSASLIVLIVEGMIYWIYILTMLPLSICWTCKDIQKSARIYDSTKYDFSYHKWLVITLDTQHIRFTYWTQILHQCTNIMWLHTWHDLIPIAHSWMNFTMSYNMDLFMNFTWRDIYDTQNQNTRPE